MDPIQEKILANPRFKDLVARRNRFSLMLTLVIVAFYAAYYAFGIFAPEAFAGSFLGLSWSKGIIFGFGMLALAFITTGIYTRRANGEFDKMLKDVLRN